MGYGENHMIIGYREQVLLPVSYPLLTFKPVALGAVAIPATVEGNVTVSALGVLTLLLMVTQLHGTALRQVGENLFLVPVKPALLLQNMAVAVDDARYFKSRFGKAH